MRLPVSGCESDELIGDLVGGVGLGSGAHCVAIWARRGRVGEQIRNEHRHILACLPVDDDQRAAGAVEVLRVLQLVVPGRVRVWDEDRRLPGSSDLPDRAAGARNDNVGCSQRSAEILDEGKSR